MSKRDVLKLPDDLDGNLRALLRTPPPPAGTPGSRKTVTPRKSARAAKAATRKAGKKR